MSRLATLPVCPKRLEFMMQIIAKTGEKSTLFNAFQRNQWPVRDHLVTIVQLDLPYPLMRGDRRFQLFLSITYFALMFGTSDLGNASQKS